MQGWFLEIADHRKKGVKIPLKDALMSAFAMFSLKFPSLLQFEEEMRQNGQKRSNLNSVFGVDAVASDTQVREIIDEIDSETTRPIFRKIFGFFQRSRELERYGFIKHGQASPYYLVQGLRMLFLYVICFVYCHSNVGAGAKMKCSKLLGH